MKKFSLPRVTQENETLFIGEGIAQTFDSHLFWVAPVSYLGLGRETIPLKAVWNGDPSKIVGIHIAGLVIGDDRICKDSFLPPFYTVQLPDYWRLYSPPVKLWRWVRSEFLCFMPVMAHKRNICPVIKCADQELAIRLETSVCLKEHTLTFCGQTDVFGYRIRGVAVYFEMGDQ